MDELADNVHATCRLLRRLGHPTRLSILCSLCAGEKCVAELTCQLGLRQSNMSQHLRKLRSAKLVKTRRSHTKVYYSLENENAGPLLAFLRGIQEANRL